MFLDKILFLFFLTLPFQLGRHFWPENSTIFGLKIDYLAPTLYLQDLFILLILSFSLFGFIKKRKKFVFLKVFSKKQMIFFFTLFLASLLNICFSLNKTTSFFTWLRIFEMIALGVFIFQNFKKTIKSFYQAVPIVIIFEFLLSLFQVIKQSSLGGVFWFFGERTFNVSTPGIARAMFLDKVFLRPYGTFSHPNSLAGFTLVLLILLFGKKNLSLIDKIAVFLCSILILLTFSRTVWITACLIGLFYLLVLIKKRIFKKDFSFNFYYLMIIIFLPIIGYFFARTTLEASSVVGRIQLAQVASSIIKKYPLFGVGAGNFIVALSRENFSWPWLYWLQPVHNIFLLLVAEQGFIFIVVTTYFMYRLFKNWFYSPIKTPFQKSLAVCVLAIFFTGLFDHYWLTLIQNQLLFVLIVSFLAASLSATIKPNE